MAAEVLSHIGVSWVQFAVGMVLFIMYFYMMNDILHDWYFSDINSSGTATIEVAILFLPLGWMLFQSSLHRLLVFQPKYYPKEVTISFLLMCIVASCVIGFVYFFAWEGVAIITMDEDVETPAQICLSIALFVICMGYFVVLALILFRMCMLTQFSHEMDYSALGSDAEQRGLLELQTGAGAGADTAADTGNKDRDDEKTDTSGTQPQRKSSYGSVYTARRAKEEAMWGTYESVKEYTFVILFFLIIIPGLLFLNGVFPSDWHKFFPVYIETYNETASNGGWVNNIAFTFRGDTYYMKIFGDLIVYFVFISGVSVISWLSMKFVSVRLLLRKRILVAPTTFSFSLGQLIFWILWVVLMFIEIYYWLGVHLYEAENTKENTEIWARFCGVLSLIFLSFMFFTVTRIRLWTDCFGLSSDHLVLMHRIFAYCMIISSYAHMIFWIVYFWKNGDGYYLDDNFIFVGSIPFTYSSDNWTLAVMEALMIFFVPLAYFVFASSYVRRKFFELFYIVHVYSACVFTVAILWHASQGWRYLLPCLMLYYVDRCLRFYYSTNFVRVNSLDTTRIGASANSESIVRVGFTVPTWGSGPHGKTRAVYGNLRYQMGQYCFINVPSISSIEWHPFTISSGPFESQITFHIKSMGENQFSGKLCELEKTFGNDSVSGSLQETGDKRPLHELEFHIDGPYGIPFSYEGYNRIVLVAGGIGITPCHSMFSGMLSLARAQLKESGNVTMPHVHMIWMVRNPEMFDVFNDTWKAAQTTNGESGQDSDLFSLHFYHTKPSEQDRKNAEILRNGLRYQAGRPRMDNALKFLEDGVDESCLVFCCGPEGLADDCELTATKYGAHYYGESFDFSKGDDIKIGSITFFVFGVCIVIMAAICEMY